MIRVLWGGKLALASGPRTVSAGAALLASPGLFQGPGLGLFDTRIVTRTDSAYVETTGAVEMPGWTEASDYLRALTATVYSGVVHMQAWPVTGTLNADWADDPRSHLHHGGRPGRHRPP